MQLADLNWSQKLQTLPRQPRYLADSSYRKDESACLIDILTLTPVTGSLEPIRYNLLSRGNQWEICLEWSRI